MKRLAKHFWVHIGESGSWKRVLTEWKAQMTTEGVNHTHPGVGGAFLS